MSRPGWLPSAHNLALSGIVGTTPGQRLALPIMEGAIIASWRLPEPKVIARLVAE
jgi:hypothetical protein